MDALVGILVSFVLSVVMLPPWFTIKVIDAEFWFKRGVIQ